MRVRFPAFRLILSVIALLAAIAFFLSIDWSQRFATDVSELLPPADAFETDAKLLTQLREQEERLLLGALVFPDESSPDRRDEAEEQFQKQLLTSGVFEKVAFGRGPSDSRRVFEELYGGRFDLLLPQWAKAAGIAPNETDPSVWAGEIAASLDDFLVRSEATAAADLLPADPFPLVGYLIDSVPPAFGEHADSAVRVFWAIQKAPPFLPEGQTPVFAALETAADSARQLVPELEIRTTSVAKFAAESEGKIRAEITGINLLSLLLVGAIVWIFLRQRSGLLHLVVIVGGSLAGGLAGVLLFFPAVHVLALVVGGLLAGVAVDYGIHILLHRSSADLGFRAVLREVRKPLLGSGLSTAAGFSALLFAELPLLRQIGAFVACGLLAALAACWLYLPLWKRRSVSAKSAISSVSKKSVPKGAIVILAAVFLLPVFGWLRLDWHDDLRELQPPMPELLENDADVRALFSGGGTGGPWICFGETLVEARETLADFGRAWTAAGASPAALASLAPWIAEPGESETVRKAFAEMKTFDAVLTDELEARGFEAEAFAPFFKALRDWISSDAGEYEKHLTAVAAALDGPAGLLMRDGREFAFFLVSAPPDGIPENWNPPPGAIPAAQLETLNELFSRYRQSAWQLSGFSFAVIVAGVFLAFRRSTPVILAVPVLAWVWGVGFLGWAASPLNLFHLLGGFLGFCLALDYGLFFEFARKRAEPVPASIRVSAATSLAAFGVLGLAGIPAVAALGRSVFLVVLAALVLIELSSLWNRAAGKLS